jgi:hypothetical protein
MLKMIQKNERFSFKFFKSKLEHLQGSTFLKTLLLCKSSPVQSYIIQLTLINSNMHLFIQINYYAVFLESNHKYKFKDKNKIIMDIIKTNVNSALQCSTYAKAGGHMIFLFPPTFIPVTPMSQPFITSPRPSLNLKPGP